ncbi:type II secretion system F family protein [Amnibacterium kyonggiense]|uniref:Type IV pilus assembly protein PilC n=1 Tax=Amnibacterium kyonggiense TaxID=595671 RepID=A0A4R7FQN7_9MICO|nr:type II secretion system F family protein [Amnibacterium kyonggiense]TDS80102.1 type IV pilus assembly protein PilC [Amnibacterium kyonggiense]
MAGSAVAQKGGARAANKEFAYRARNAEGKIVKGAFDVPTEAAAASRLLSMGLSPVSIAEKEVGSGLNKEISLGFLSKGIKTTHLAVATRQLATMTNSGLALLRAVTVVADQTENEKLQALLHDVARDIETGNSFSDSLAKHKEIPLIMVSMLRAGEAGGFLDIALAAVATTFEKEAKLKATIKSAMTYPAAVLGIAVIAVVAMLLFIVPIFKKMFEGFGKALPLPTQILVDISDNMVWIIPTAIVLIVTLTALWRAKKDADAVRRVVHPLLLKFPIFGPLMGKVAISRFARNLANMTHAGVPLLRALQIVGQASGNWVIEQTANRVAESIRLGGSMAEPLSEEKIFPAMVVQMVAVGEESGSVDVMLGKVADFYDDEIEATSAALTSLIEPLLICVLGVVVGGMVVALYMPIFSIASAVH